MRRLQSDAWAVLLTALFYGSFAWEQFHPPSNPAAFTSVFGITLAVLVALTRVLYSLPWDRWVYLIACLVPLEITGARWVLPSLSPIDYLCAAALTSLLCRIGP